MQTLSTQFAAALSGSWTPVHILDAWYGGRLVYSGVPIVSGQVTLDSSRKVAGGLNVNIASEDQALVPVNWNSPLAPYGSELQIRVGIAYPSGLQELLSLGWFRIESCDPHQSFGRYVHRNGTVTRVFRGLSAAVEASDRMALIDDARLLAPTQPASLASCQAEIGRLISGIVPRGDWSGVADAAIPRALAYEESRTDAIGNLAEVMNCDARMDPDGGLDLYPRTIGASQLTVSVPDSAISWDGKLTRDGIFNSVVAKGEANTVVQGVATENYGPLRWGGPFGYVPLGYSSPLLTSNAMATTAAVTRLRNVAQDRVMDIQVVIPPNPAIQLGDVITVVGETGRSLTGPITAITWPIPLAETVVKFSTPRSSIWGM